MTTDNSTAGDFFKKTLQEANLGGNIQDKSKGYIKPTKSDVEILENAGKEAGVIAAKDPKFSSMTPKEQSAAIISVIKKNENGQFNDANKVVDKLADSSTFAKMAKGGKQGVKDALFDGAETALANKLSAKRSELQTAMAPKTQEKQREAEDAGKSSKPTNNKEVASVPQSNDKVAPKNESKPTEVASAEKTADVHSDKKPEVSNKNAGESLSSLASLAAQGMEGVRDFMQNPSAANGVRLAGIGLQNAMAEMQKMAGNVKQGVDVVTNSAPNAPQMGGNGISIG